MRWKVQGSIPDNDSDLYLLQNVHTGSGTNPSFYSGDTWCVPPELMYEPDNSHLSTAKVEIIRVVRLLLYIPSWPGQGQLYLQVSQCESNQWLNESAMSSKL